MGKLGWDLGIMCHFVSKGRFNWELLPVFSPEFIGQKAQTVSMTVPLILNVVIDTCCCVPLSTKHFSWVILTSNLHWVLWSEPRQFLSSSSSSGCLKYVGFEVEPKGTVGFGADSKGALEVLTSNWACLCLHTLGSFLWFIFSGFDSKLKFFL